MRAYWRGTLVHMFDLYMCGVCEFQFVDTLPTCPRCGWRRNEGGSGGVREPDDPSPDGLDPGVLCPV